MNNIRKALADALAAPEAPIVNVVFSSSMESAKIDVLSMESFGFNELSMETQQMEDHLTKLVDHKIEQILQPVPKPTAPTAFVVSRKGLTDGVISDQEVVRAAVQAKLEEPNDDIVLAVLPEDATVASDEPEEHIESIRQFATGADVPVVESMEALQEYLSGTCVSNEGLFDAIKRLFKKKQETNQIPEESNTVEQWEREWREVNRILSNSSEIDKLPLKTGDIHASNFSSHLLGEATTVDAVIRQCRSHLQTTPKVISDLRNGVKQLHKFQQSLAIKLQEDPDFDVIEACKREGYRKLNPCKLTQQENNKLLPGTDLYFDETYQSWMYGDKTIHGAKTLPALTHVQIKNFAKLLIDIERFLSNGPSKELGDDVLWGPYTGDRAPLEAVYLAVRGSDSPAEQLFVFKAIEDYGWVSIPHHMESALELAQEAIVTWIYRSIRDDK